MTKLAKIMLIALTLSAFGIYLTSCNKSDSILETIVDSNVDQKFTVENGMLVFESREDMDLTLVELRSSPLEDFSQWEAQTGVSTIYGAFNAVVEAESAISDYYESLTLDEQKKYRDMPEINSELYKEMMDKDIIKIIEDNDGTSYFDYAVFDPSMAPILNMDGFVKMENKIYQYTNEGFKIILDGDFKKISELLTVKDTYEGDKFLIFVEDESEKGRLNYNWTVNNGWSYSGNRRRYKVWVDGRSYAINGTFGDCAPWTQCVNTVRTQAQWRNFWGNWRYNSGKFNPSFSYTNSWDFDYELYSGSDCNNNSDPTGITFYNIVPTYSCTGNPNYNCPTSPHSASYSGTNNGYFNHTPHGTWNAQSLSQFLGYNYDYFTRVIDIDDGEIDATYNGNTTSYDFTYESF